MMLKKHKGSCRCGAIRYEVEVDLETGTTQCNCTRCAKLGWWGAHVKPSAFEPLAENPTRTISTEITSVSCAACNIVVYDEGNLPELGGAFVSFNVRTLDDVDLNGIVVTYLDGLHDTWEFLAMRPWSDPFIRAPETLKG